MALSFNDVNRRGSFTWIRCNDDAKSSYFRDVFTKRHGGEFVKSGRYWEWVPKNEQLIVLESSITQPAAKEESKPEGEKTWIFLDQDGNEHSTKNIQEFCKEKSLTRSSLYEVISGRRNSHKGFSLKTIIIE